MQNKQVLNGSCYLCGLEDNKIKMKNHILKHHNDLIAEQDCYLLKIEGLYDKNYWLFIEIPKDKTLSYIDSFLRKIWLECCGHLSAFYGSGHSDISKSRKIGTFTIGDKIGHQYDFGTTTDTLISFIAEKKRETQKEAVRLLARNVPYEYFCETCKKPADNICVDCINESENPYYCESCSESHSHEFLLTITNSPRMGACGYSGELDKYTFDITKFKTI